MPLRDDIYKKICCTCNVNPMTDALTTEQIKTIIQHTMSRRDLTSLFPNENKSTFTEALHSLVKDKMIYRYYADLNKKTFYNFDGENYKPINSPHANLENKYSNRKPPPLQFFARVGNISTINKEDVYRSVFYRNHMMFESKIIWRVEESSRRGHGNDQLDFFIPGHKNLIRLSPEVSALHNGGTLLVSGADPFKMGPLEYDLGQMFPKDFIQSLNKRTSFLALPNKFLCPYKESWISSKKELLCITIGSIAITFDAAQINVTIIPLGNRIKVTELDNKKLNYLLNITTWIGRERNGFIWPKDNDTFPNFQWTELNEYVEPSINNIPSDLRLILDKPFSVERGQPWFIHNFKPETFKLPILIQLTEEWHMVIAGK